MSYRPVSMLRTAANGSSKQASTSDHRYLFFPAAGTRYDGI